MVIVGLIPQTPCFRLSGDYSCFILDTYGTGSGSKMRSNAADGRKHPTISATLGKYLSLCLGAALLATSDQAPAQTPLESVPLRVDDYSDKYDEYFRHYAQRYFGPFIDWRWFKAQAVAESLLNPQAVSHANAQGVMQLLPSTFEEVRLTNPNWDDIYTPRWNIAAGIFYNYTLYQQWNGSLHGHDRFLLTLASYNAGFQRVRYAYGVVNHVRNFNDIQQRLPAETRGYVERIQSLMQPKPLEVAPVVATID